MSAETPPPGPWLKVKGTGGAPPLPAPLPAFPGLGLGAQVTGPVLRGLAALPPVPAVAPTPPPPPPAGAGAGAGIGTTTDKDKPLASRLLAGAASLPKGLGYSPGLGGALQLAGKGLAYYQSTQRSPEWQRYGKAVKAELGRKKGASAEEIEGVASQIAETTGTQADIMNRELLRQSLAGGGAAGAPGQGDVRTQQEAIAGKTSEAAAGAISEYAQKNRELAVAEQVAALQSYGQYAAGEEGMKQHETEMLLNMVDPTGGSLKSLMKLMA